VRSWRGRSGGIQRPLGLGPCPCGCIQRTPCARRAKWPTCAAFISPDDERHRRTAARRCSCHAPPGRDRPRRPGSAAVL